MATEAAPGTVNPGDKVCVTGSNGFIGTYIVRDLLTDGYRVRATVRDPSNPAKTEHLRAIAQEVGAAERLEIVSGDLLAEGSFDAAIAGCDGVVHCAAAVFFTAQNPQQDIVDPSVKGTLNVLRSVEKAGTVKRVVHTSSIAAVYSWDKPAGYVFSEKDWNTTSTLSTDPYALAKVEAEKAAVAFHEGLPAAGRFDLVHLNPGMVFGPPIIKAHAKASPMIVRDVISRAQPGVPNIMLSVVDVREVSAAHVAALKAENPPPRCLLAGHDEWMPDLMARLQGLFPDIKMGTRKLPKLLVIAASLFDKGLHTQQLWNLINTEVRVDHSLSEKAYGVRYRPLDEVLADTARPMIDNGWARTSRA